jgi:hypothetical protein
LHESPIYVFKISFSVIFSGMEAATTDQYLADKVNALHRDCLRIKQDVDQWMDQGHIEGLYRFDQMVTAELKFINKVTPSLNV